MSEAEVIVRVEGRVGRLTLNRPRALHALTTTMCELMTEAMLAWRCDPSIDAVLIDHSGERGFCAGGDIRMLAESGAGDGVLARNFFFVEYRLNHLMFVYPKPIIAIMDGITMGGGVGISMPAQYRVATERTIYAMPETGIGLFPDVGGGWFLSRMPGKAGVWLALTGARVKAADCLALGIASHYIPSAETGAVKAAICADPASTAAILDDAKGDAGPALLQGHRAEIDRLFAGDTVEAIFAALEADGGEWAKGQLQILKTKSPQALKVSLRQLRTSARLANFAQNMAMEHGLGVQLARRHDFQEGVRAVIIDKDNQPRWDPPTLEGVTPDILDAIFAPPKPGRGWTPLPELS